MLDEVIDGHGGERIAVEFHPTGAAVDGDEGRPFRADVQDVGIPVIFANDFDRGIIRRVAHDRLPASSRIGGHDQVRSHIVAAVSVNGHVGGVAVVVRGLDLRDVEPSDFGWGHVGPGPARGDSASDTTVP